MSKRCSCACFPLFSIFLWKLAIFLQLKSSLPPCQQWHPSSQTWSGGATSTHPTPPNMPSSGHVHEVRQFLLPIFTIFPTSDYFSSVEKLTASTTSVVSQLPDMIWSCLLDPTKANHNKQQGPWARGDSACFPLLYNPFFATAHYFFLNLKFHSLMPTETSQSQTWFGATTYIYTMPATTNSMDQEQEVW